MRTFLILLALAAVSPMTQAQSVAPVPVSADATVIQVQASGSASGVPNIGMISAGVVTQDSDSSRALAANARQMNQVMAALRKAGVPDRDIQTGTLNLMSQYQHTDNQPPILASYQAINNVHIRLRNPSMMGKIIDTLAREGANQIDGPHFTIENPVPLEQQARLAALADARAQADTYANALGLKVRRVLTIHDSGHSAPGPLFRRAQMASAEMGDTSVAPGESQIQVNLSVSYELGQ